MKNLYLAVCVTLVTAPVFSQTYTGGGGPINDYATTDYPVVVSGLTPSTIDSLNFGLETVCIDLTHTWDSDLDIRIIAPDGTSALLTGGQGGSDDDYTNTCFNQYASLPISSGIAPFTGTFKPMGQIGLINNGQNGNGTWVLRVVDTYPADAGNVISFSITFGNNPATATPFVSSDLPILVINTNFQSIPNDPKLMADMGIIYNGPGNRNYMTDPFNHYNGKVGIETRGASSQMFPKKPYGIELWDVNGNPIDSALLGMPKESDWVLIANYSDKSLLNNTLTYELARQMGWYAARYRFVEMVINGEYAGVYVLAEKIKRDNNRLDLAKVQPQDISGDEVTGGYIIKVDRPNAPGFYSTYLSPNGSQIYVNYVYPNGAEIMPQQEAYIQAYLDSFETALYGPNFRDTVLGYRHYMDFSSLVDYFILSELSHNVDGYRLSTFMYKQKITDGGKLFMGPVWDYDISWGNANYCYGGDVTGWAYQTSQVCPGGEEVPFWWSRLVQDTNFTNRVRCRWEELRTGLLSDSSMYSYCDSMALYLDESQQRNFATWPTLGTYVWPNPAPYPTSYAGEITELKNYIGLRAGWMDANLPGNMNGCNLTGTPEQSADPYAVPPAYPNPFSSAINLSIYFPQPQTVEIELVNALGQTVQPAERQQHNGGTQVFTFTPSADLPPGIYLLRITAGNKTWTQQLSKVE